MEEKDKDIMKTIFESIHRYRTKYYEPCPNTIIISKEILHKINMDQNVLDRIKYSTTNNTLTMAPIKFIETFFGLKVHVIRDDPIICFAEENKNETE